VKIEADESDAPSSREKNQQTEFFGDKTAPGYQYNASGPTFEDVTGLERRRKTEPQQEKIKQEKIKQKTSENDDIPSQKRRLREEQRLMEERRALFLRALGIKATGGGGGGGNDLTPPPFLFTDDLSISMPISPPTKEPSPKPPPPPPTAAPHPFFPDLGDDLSFSFPLELPQGKPNGGRGKGANKSGSEIVKSSKASRGKGYLRERTMKRGKPRSTRFMYKLQKTGTSSSTRRRDESVKRVARGRDEETVRQRRLKESPHQGDRARRKMLLSELL
jgi:hypothetical protein